MFQSGRFFACVLGAALLGGACARPSETVRPASAPLIRELEVLRPIVLVAYIKVKISDELVSGLWGMKLAIFPTVVIPTGKRKVSRICALIGNKKHFGNQAVSPSLWAEGRRLSFINGSSASRLFMDELYKEQNVAALGLNTAENAYSFDRPYMRQDGSYWLLEFEDGTHSLLEPFDASGLSSESLKAFNTFRQAARPDFVDVFLRSKYADRFQMLQALSKMESPNLTKLVSLRKELEGYRESLLRQPIKILEAKAWFDRVFLESTLQEMRREIAVQSAELQSLRWQLADLEGLENTVKGVLELSAAEPQPDLERERVAQQLPVYQERITTLKRLIRLCEDTLTDLNSDQDDYGAWNSVQLVTQALE